MCAWALWCEVRVGRRRVGVCERVCAHACARVRECVWMWSRLVPILILLFPRQRCGVSKSVSKSAALGGVTDLCRRLQQDQRRGAQRRLHDRLGQLQ